MKFSQIIIYLIIIVILFVTVKYVNNTQKVGHKIISKKIDFSKFNDKNTSYISMKKGKEVVELKKDAGIWRVKNKFSYKANDESIKNLFNTIKNLKMNDIVSKNPNKKSRFNLDTQGVEVVLKNDNNKELVSLTVGKPGPAWSSNYFSVKGSDYVYQSSKWLSSSIKTNSKEFLDKKLFDIKKDDIEKFNIIYGTKEVEASKIDGGWQLSKPKKLFADTKEVEKICTSIASLKLYDIKSNIEKPEYGLSTSEIKVSFSTSDQTEYSFKIGNKNKKGNYYIKTNKDNYIGLIQKYNFSGLEPKLDKLKKKVVKVIKNDLSKYNKKPKICSDKENPEVIIVTDKGDMTFKLFENDAPNTVANFISLIEKKFYDGLKFHRVIKDFMAQGGCPYSRDGSKGTPGTGGPGYTIKCEINKNKNLRGSLSMAHAGKDTGGSQFFICFKPQPHLDGVHTVFGKLKKGYDVLDKITKNIKIIGIRVLKKRNHKYIPVTYNKK